MVVKQHQISFAFQVVQDDDFFIYLVWKLNLPMFLPKLMTKICHNMPRKVKLEKRFTKLENTGKMEKIKILFIYHGNI